MADGRHCPACRWDIGLWPVFKAPLPHLIRCPHCSARLRYSRVGGVAAVLVVVVAGLAVGGHFAAGLIAAAWAEDIQPMARLVVFSWLLLAGWIPVELATAWFLRGNRRLVLGAGGPGAGGPGAGGPGAGGDATAEPGAAADRGGV
jgi:uncharacterized protein (DUF983 family)